MKTVFKVISSLLLSVSIGCSLFAVLPAAAVAASNNLLVDLDLTNMALSVGTAPYTGTSGVVDNGSWAASTNLVIRSRNEVTMSKGTFSNADGTTTNYLDLQNAHPEYQDMTIGFNFSNSALEANDNTISFWVDATRYPNKNTEVLQYLVNYNNGSRASFDLSMTSEGKWNAQSDATATTNDCYTLVDGWKHIVITNPRRSGGSKTMNMYVNGVLKDTVTLSIPDGATIQSATVSFAARDEDGTGFKKRVLISAKYGEIKVYSGVLSESEIKALYSANLNKFVEGSAPSPSITGYSFQDQTVKYDGQSHRIEVTAEAGATECDDIVYTYGGEPFNGATERGTYEITATLKKDGYSDRVLNATLEIVPYDANVDFKVYNSANNEINSSISTSQLGDAELTGSLTISKLFNIPITARLFAAVYEGADLLFTKVMEPSFTLSAEQDSLSQSYDLSDVFSKAYEGEVISFFVWDDKLIPLTDKMDYSVVADEYAEGGTYRLIINMTDTPNAAMLKPGNFTATAGNETLEIERTIYYPLTNELHLVLSELPLLTVPYTVTANIKDIYGGQLVINTTAAALGYSSTPVYENSVKYVKLSQNGAPVTRVSADGTYSIDIGAALQGKTNATVRLFKKGLNGVETDLGTQTVSFTDNEEPLTFTASLSAGDKVFAEIIN